MSQHTNRAPTPPSVTGRRRRFTGAHPYPALPQSRLPLLRGVLWVTWAAIFAVFEALRDVVFRRRSRSDTIRDPRGAQTSSARPPRVPSLTPTG